MQHVAKKSSTKPAAVQTRPILLTPSTVMPAVQRRQQVQRDLQRFTARPASAQRQVAAPVLRAAQLNAQETGQLVAQQQTVQRHMTALSTILPHGAVEAALQRQAQSSVPAAVIKTPQSPSDWVTVMRQRAEAVEGQRLDPKAYGQFTALQRQVAGQLTTAFKQDRQPAAERHQVFAAHLASLQRHPLSRPVAQVVLGSLPVGERPAIQRAVDEVQEQEALQRQQDGQALELYSLQRQLAELDEQATKPVMERIQARRGSGNPLPAAVQRHLEQGLNHDLSRVRIHDDAEADKLAKGVNAVAFTTGTDIYFRSGTFNPNTKSGLELLAHEVTHTVQQAQGKVSKGIDPDAALEAEARSMGSKLASVMPSAKSLMPPSPHAPGVYTKAAALQRAQDAAAQTFALKPLYDLQPHALQRLGNPFKWVGDKVQDGVQAVANKGKEMIAGALMQMPGYRELTLAFGKDLVTGKAVAQNPNTILDVLTSWVPGPLKDILRALKETNALPKAWAWFRAELAKLNLAGVLGEVASAIGKADLGAAKTAVTSRIGGLKALIVGSAKKIAEIGLTALAAGLGPVAQGVIARLRQSGDLIIQVLKNPVKFAGNLLNALKGGFKSFAGNAPKHLQSGLGQWLTGASGISFPAKLDLQGVFLTALSVMGLTYQAMRGRLVKAMGPNGEKQVRAAEGTLDALKTLRGGLHKSDEMKANQAPVGNEVVAGLKSEITKSMVMAGITKVASMLIPGGGFVQAMIGAFRSVQFVIEQGKQIMGVITSAVQSVGAIAAGNIGGAVKGVESTLARSIPVALGFLGKVLGLGNIGAKVKNVIAKVKGKLDALLDKAVARIKKLIGSSKQMAGKAVNKAKELIRGIFGKKTFTAGKETHSIWFDTNSGKPQLWVASTPREARVQLHYAHREASVNIKNANGKISLAGKTYTKSTIDSDRDKGEGKIAKALDAVSGSSFSTLDRPEKVKTYFTRMSNAHFNGIEQHFKILFSVAEANQTDRSKLKAETFYFTRRATMDKDEYERQVGYANAELKAMTVETFLKRRTQVISTNRRERNELGVVENGRDYQEGAAMSQVRTEAMTRLQKLIELTRDGQIQQAEQDELNTFVGLLRTSLKDLRLYQVELNAKPNKNAKTKARLRSLTQAITKITLALPALNPIRSAGMSAQELKQAAAELLGSLALLHSLDQVGGGSAIVFPGSGLDAYGVTRINSSIGASWKGLVRKIEDHVRLHVSPGHYATVSMSPITLDVRQG